MHVRVIKQWVNVHRSCVKFVQNVLFLLIEEEHEIVDKYWKNYKVVQRDCFLLNLVTIVEIKK